MNTVEQLIRYLSAMDHCKADPGRVKNRGMGSSTFTILPYTQATKALVARFLFYAFHSLPYLIETLLIPLRTVSADY